MLPVRLSPSPGLCIKSSATVDGAYNAAPSGDLPAQTIAVPKGIKVFINISYDDNVPPPPEGSEDGIRRAMAGEDANQDNDGWFVPVVVSNGREDKDKGE
jgi:hypothetical protein